jgi:hypothetical protein
MEYLTHIILIRINNMECLNQSTILLRNLLMKVGQLLGKRFTKIWQELQAKAAL